MARDYLFTWEAVGKCEGSADAEYWLRVASYALEQAGFAMGDAQAIGIDGAPGAAIDFPDPRPKLLKPNGTALPGQHDQSIETRRLTDPV